MNTGPPLAHSDIPVSAADEAEPATAPAPGPLALAEGPGGPATATAPAPAAAEAAVEPTSDSLSKQSDAQSDAQYKCSICKKDHKTSLCPTPTCWICNGTHWASTCTRPVCTACSPVSDCPVSNRHHRYYCPKAPCLLCNKKCHTAADCGKTVKWSNEERRYVPRGPPLQVTPTPPVDVECWNCGIKGHYSSDCKRPIQCHKCLEEGHYGHSCPTVQAAPSLSASASSLISAAAATATAALGSLILRRCRSQPDPPPGPGVKQPDEVEGGAPNAKRPKLD